MRDCKPDSAIGSPLREILQYRKYGVAGPAKIGAIKPIENEAVIVTKAAVLKRSILEY